jgi:hypothetical protein
MLARVAVALTAVLLAFLGAAFVVAGVDIADTPTCKDVNAGLEQPRDGECYDGSTARRAGQTGLSIAAGVVGILALIPGLAYAIRRRWLLAFGVMVGMAVALAVLYALLGRIG